MYFDVGEYGLGFLVYLFQLFNDCFCYVKYFDVVFVVLDGILYVILNMICIFEWYVGDIVW